MADPTTCLQCRQLSPEREGDSFSGGDGGDRTNSCISEGLLIMTWCLPLLSIFWGRYLIAV